MASINKINPQDFLPQSYNPQDISLISNNILEEEFSNSSYIEFYIFDLNQNQLTSNLNYTNYTVLDSNGDIATNTLSEIITNPQEDLEKAGFSEGSYIAYYNFLNKQIGDPSSNLYISEISSDRTELKLDSTVLSTLEILNQTSKFINQRNQQDYFVDFYLNFSGNELFIANNIKLENNGSSNPNILIKLYEPLPLEYSLNSQLWIVTSINTPQAFEVTFPEEPIEINDFTQISGPNFNIPLKDQVNNSSQNLSYTDIISSAPTSSQNQINSLLEESSIDINVDYTNFKNFIHFSSAQTRIENFYYKVGLIESYTSQTNILLNITSSTTSNNITQNKISNIIKNFDKFEYFMYYSSGSNLSYPKSTPTKPYILFPTTSSQALTWLGSEDINSNYFGGLMTSSGNYDNNNPNYLSYSIPEYLREDPANQPYNLFVDMVAQYYDNVWLYTKDITQKYNADNRLDFGVSKDLVSDAIKDFSVKLYQNNFSDKELYTAFLGITPNGSLFPFPEITGSLPAPTGFEFVDTLISASNDVISMDDTNKSLYKRIYHNIPYLLKSKGTIAGLRALITSYGIPDTILKISEFGGKDKVNANDYDLYFNNFNYALKVGPEANYISSSFLANSNWNTRPQTVEFRFKPEKLTTTTSPYGLTNLSQSLFTLENEFGTPQYLDIVLEYSGSGLSTGSYSGAPKDPNYQYGNLKLIPNTGDPSTSASIYLPFFNGDWWSVMLTSNLSTGLTLSTGNKIYNGNDGTSLGFYDTASILASNPYSNSNKSYFSTGSLYSGFSGSLQEVRYYKPIISQSVFKDYIMNPLSFEGNGVNSAPDQLIFRAALGSELDINTSTSIHPKVTGSWATTSSFGSDSNFYFNNTPSYSKNTEYFFLDQPAVGIKNRITDKIRSESNTLPSGNVLSPIRRLSQTTEASASYTPNVNYLEVAFSPQNQINDDIIGQIGHFNIGDYIGDPAQRFTGNNYPDLNNLSEDYFKKYIKQYDLVDFVRLIKFFDNSLFKMIKDFIPARTSLASGIVIKQHLLERNKYPQPIIQPLTNELLTGSIKSKQIWDVASQTTKMTSSPIPNYNGGAAGLFNPFNINYDLVESSSIETTTFNFSATVESITPPSELGTTISFGSGIITTTAPNLEYFERFISASYDGNPNLWMDLSGEGVQIINPFNSGSTGVRRARVADIDLTTNSLTLVNGYVVSAAGAGAYQFTFYTASVGATATNFQSSSQNIVNNENYYYDTTPQFNVTQSYTITTPSLSGSVTKTHRSQDEFYNGELSGSTLIISNGELNEGCAQFKFVNPEGGNYGIRSYNSTNDDFEKFINNENFPLQGFIQTWFQDDNVSGPLPPPNPSE